MGVEAAFAAYFEAFRFSTRDYANSSFRDKQDTAHPAVTFGAVT